MDIFQNIRFTFKRISNRWTIHLPVSRKTYKCTFLFSNLVQLCMHMHIWTKSFIKTCSTLRNMSNICTIILFWIHLTLINTLLSLSRNVLEDIDYDQNGIRWIQTSLYKQYSNFTGDTDSDKWENQIFIIILF
jgi:hypothetical protein